MWDIYTEILKFSGIFGQQIDIIIDETHWME